MPDIIPDPLLTPEHFDQLIKNKGIRFKHYSAAPCPNLTDINRQDHDPNCTKCEQGMIYWGGKEIMGLFNSHQLQKMYEIQGTWSVGQAVVSMQAHYDNGDLAYFQHLDKLVCLDYTAKWYQLVEHNPMTGIDRLKYPALTIEYLATTDRIYTYGKDYALTSDGFVRWIPTGSSPKFDQKISDHGQIYTIVYTFTPVFYVYQVMHELRATQGQNAMGEKVTSYLPQQLLISRDYVFQHPGDHVGLPSANSPRSGGNVFES